MRRREFIGGLGSTAAWPLAARAQQSGRMRRVAMLMGVSGTKSTSQSYAAIFQEALAKLGWIEGRNLQIDLRFAIGKFEQIRAVAAQLVSLDPEVIFTFTGEATRAAQQQTQVIPIVFAGPSVEITSIKNIAHPEGNITGLPVVYTTMGGKWVQLLKEVAPGIRRVAAPSLPERGLT
jgi:putative ABC transport system substrate-binding protein